MGREKITDVRKIVGMPTMLAERIRRFRFAREHGTEAEAIRVLLEKGLDAEGFGIDAVTGGSTFPRKMDDSTK